jgi:hypothetical protein
MPPVADVAKTQAESRSRPLKPEAPVSVITLWGASGVGWGTPMALDIAFLVGPETISGVLLVFAIPAHPVFTTLEFE